MKSNELLKSILKNSKSLKEHNRTAEWDESRKYKEYELFITAKQFSFLKSLIMKEKYNIGAVRDMVYVGYNGVRIEFFKHFNGAYMMKIEKWCEKTDLFSIVEK